MLDIGWQELLVIGALALIVVGPKDLPSLLRSCGQWVAKIRGMAREFQRSMDQAARDADMTNVKELRDLKNDLGSLDLKGQAYKAISSDDAAAKLATKTTTESETSTPIPDSGTVDPGMVDETSAEPSIAAPAEPAQAVEK